MPQPIIQQSFSAGEIAPNLWGRTDLAKYRTGLGTARNFFVDYRGGVSTRAGTAYVGPCAGANAQTGTSGGSSGTSGGRPKPLIELQGTLYGGIGGPPPRPYANENFGFVQSILFSYTLSQTGVSYPLGLVTGDTVIQLFAGTNGGGDPSDITLPVVVGINIQCYGVPGNGLITVNGQGPTSGNNQWGAGLSNLITGTVTATEMTNQGIIGNAQINSPAGTAVWENVVLVPPDAYTAVFGSPELANLACMASIAIQQDQGDETYDLVLFSLSLAKSGTSPTPITGYIQGSAPRLLPWVFDTNDTYVIELSNQLIRFITDGAYVTETPLTIAGCNTLGALAFNVPGTDANVGDQVYVTGVIGLVRPNGISGVNGRTFTVAENAGGYLFLSDPISGNFIDASTWTTFGGGGTLARIYAIASPYLEADLFSINYAQSADVMDLAHPNYPQYELKRFGAADWTLTAVTIGPTISPPTNLQVKAIGIQFTPQYTQTFGYDYVVTAVNTATNEESEISNYGYVTNFALNQSPASGQLGVENVLTWNAVEGANAYRVYKALPSATAPGPPPYFMGFIGDTTNTTFKDTNIEPDFATVYPSFTNPFASGPLGSLTIETSGFGFINPQISINDPKGTGATATATVNASGSLATVTLNNVGQNYQAPTVTVYEGNTASGTGLVVAFSGSWVAGNGGFYPATGSITITTGGSGYHVPQVYLSGTIGTGSNVASFVQGLYEGQTTEAVVTSLFQKIAFFATTTDNNPPNSDNTYMFTIQDLDAQNTDGAAYVAATVAGANNPGVVSYFDQRRVYAASLINPDTFWMSKPGSYQNFDTSYPSQDDDAITGTIVGQEVNAITSLTPMSGGLIALTSNGAYQINGGSAAAALTPESVDAAAQAFSGAAPLNPLRIVNDLVYLQARGSAVRDLTYNYYLNVYTGQDISYLSSHLFYGRSIVQWAYAEEPFKLIWAVRDDGVLLSCAFLKEQDVCGWTRHDTAGAYTSVAVVPEGNEDAVYFAVKRWFNGFFAYVVERQATRFFGQNAGRNLPSNPENAWCVDCGAVYNPDPIDALCLTGFPTNDTGTWQFQYDDTSFTYVATEGVDVIRIGGGRGVILTANPGVLTAQMDIPPCDLIPNISQTVMQPQAANTWSIGTQITVIGGLDQFDGCYVAVVADGNVLSPQMVTDGCVTLPYPASLVLAGGAFTAQLQTLRLDSGDPTMQGRRKNIPAVTLRCMDTRGLLVGRDFTDMFEVKQRFNENYPDATQLYQDGGTWQPPPFTNGPLSPQPVLYEDTRTILQGVWEESGYLCLQQNFPMPVTLLADIPEINLGDDNSAA